MTAGPLLFSFLSQLQLNRGICCRYRLRIQVSDYSILLTTGCSVQHEIVQLPTAGAASSTGQPAKCPVHRLQQLPRPVR
jgi:hypothetical protein